MAKQKVLITGSSGLIGGLVYKELCRFPGQYDVYALSRRRENSDRISEQNAAVVPEDHFFKADITDVEAVEKAVEGMDIVVHMAACPDAERGWDTILPVNIQGTINVLEACVKFGVKRVLNASTVMVVWGYFTEEPYVFMERDEFDKLPDVLPKIDHESPPRPTCPYAASKVFGEAYARSLTENNDISIICLRIGGVQDDDISLSRCFGSIWSSCRDISQIMRRIIEAPASLKYDIFFGLSKSDYNWIDMSHAEDVLGYDAEDVAEENLA